MEISMNTLRLASLAGTAILSLGIASQAAYAQGKTRDQVQQELMQAQHDGVVPANKTRYPADTGTIKRNQDVHAVQRHDGDTSHGMDQHDSISAARQ
jgi:hypothetical protein